MNHRKDITCDILIAGSGFAGSLTALALHQTGFDVCLVEKGKHPRFAIGESSTPIADMILRDLSSQYDLPWLHVFSRYGSWQERYPEIVCGLKRGFSYYKHYRGELFSTDEKHKNELLVAASPGNRQSDTNWLRSDFDAFLVDKVREAGITYFDETEITGAGRNGEWIFRALRPDGGISFKSSFYIDATGSPALLRQLLGIESSADGFQTDSRALYSHFNGVHRWSGILENSGIPDNDYPYDPDHSALHHLMDQGWIWMLRFNDERTSVGIVLDRKRGRIQSVQPANEEWARLLDKYPSMKEVLRNSIKAPDPGRIISTGRLQRRLTRAHGPGWVALPHTAGFVDPLHSTGIAHTLTGIEKILDILSQYWDQRRPMQSELEAYERSLFKELEFVDRLVAGCYKVLDRFELFNAWSMLYFAAAIMYEQQRLGGNKPSHFLCAGEEDIVNIVNDSFDELQELLKGGSASHNEADRFIQNIRARITPYNIAGLLDPEANNMYRHTAVEL